MRPRLPEAMWLALSAALLSAPAAAQEFENLARCDAELDRLTADPRGSAALDSVLDLEDENERLLIELTEILAPRFREEARALHYAGRRRKAGLDAELDEIGNVIARREGAGTGRTLAVVVHVDTVFPEGAKVTGWRDGDRLMAPEIADDTRGLVTLLTIARLLERHELEIRDDLLFVGSVGEEGLGDLRWVKHLFRDGGPEIHAFIAIDRTSNTRVLTNAIGSHRYRVRFPGPGGHSWGAFGLGNPAHAMARAIKLFDNRAGEGEYVTSGAKTTCNIGGIGGGASVNSIPFENRMEVDMRSMEPRRLEEIDAIFQQAMADALEERNGPRRDGEELTIEIELIGDRPSGKAAVETPLIRRALAATRAVGAEPEPSLGPTDSKVPIARGIPTTTIGSGGQGSRSLEEWWANRDGHLGIRKALLLMLAEAGLAGADTN